jgi:hypothetical protein
MREAAYRNRPDAHRPARVIAMQAAKRRERL